MSSTTTSLTMKPVFEAVYPHPSAKDWLETKHPRHFSTPANGECPICIDCTVQPTVKTICGHIFHSRCLMDWFKSLGTESEYTDYEMTCPMCRKVLATVSLHFDDTDDDEDFEAGGEEESEAWLETEEERREREAVNETRWAQREEQEWLMQTLKEEREERVARERALQAKREEWASRVPFLERGSFFW